MKVFLLAAGIVVTGRVFVDDGGTPAIPAFSISFGGARQTMCRVQPDGAFQVLLPPGEYRVPPSALPFAYYLKTITAGPVDLTRTPLVVGRTAPNPIVITLGMEMKSIRMRGNP